MESEREGGGGGEGGERVVLYIHRERDACYVFQSHTSTTG